VCTNPINVQPFIVRPGEGLDAPLSRLGTIHEIPSGILDGRLAIVEHTLPPKALAAPVHRHSREDELFHRSRGDTRRASSWLLLKERHGKHAIHLAAPIALFVGAVPPKRASLQLEQGGDGQVFPRECVQTGRRRRRYAGRVSFGGRGIRTPGTVTRSVVFKTTAIDHSAIPPRGNVRGFTILHDGDLLRPARTRGRATARGGSTVRYDRYARGPPGRERGSRFGILVHHDLSLSGASAEERRPSRQPVMSDKR
jgi:hypothetical protein